jgi:hypothetical protein
MCKKFRQAKGEAAVRGSLLLQETQLVTGTLTPARDEGCVKNSDRQKGQK